MQASQPIFLYWSPAGDWLTFYEFRRAETYQVVFLQVATGQVHSAAATNGLLPQLPALSQGGPLLAAFLQRVAPSAGPLLQDAAPAELHPR